MVVYNSTEAQSLVADAHARRDRLDAIRAAISAPDSLLYALADQLEAAGREVERLTREHQERSRHVLEVEDAATSAERERDSLRQQLEGKTSELEFADRTITGAIQRIAELDAALDDAIQHDDDAAALRAIYPVYLAAEMLASHIVSQDPEFKALIEAISNASRAITPEILAALKAAGLDVP